MFIGLEKGRKRRKISQYYTNFITIFVLYPEFFAFFYNLLILLSELFDFQKEKKNIYLSLWLKLPFNVLFCYFIKSEKKKKKNENQSEIVWWKMYDIFNMLFTIYFNEIRIKLLRENGCCGFSHTLTYKNFVAPSDTVKQ